MPSTVPSSPVTPSFIPYLLRLLIICVTLFSGTFQLMLFCLANSKESDIVPKFEVVDKIHRSALL